MDAVGDQSRSSTEVGRQKSEQGGQEPFDTVVSNVRTARRASNGPRESEERDSCAALRAGGLLAEWPAARQLMDDAVQEKPDRPAERGPKRQDEDLGERRDWRLASFGGWRALSRACS